MPTPIYLSLAGARRFAWPVPDLWSTPSLSERDLRAYWHFRRGFMDLKPHIDPEDDWSRFSTWMRGADFSLLARASDGRLISVISYKIELRTHEARRVVLLCPEYGYSLPEARKTARMGVSMLSALGLGMIRHPGIPQYVVGTGYLPGFLALREAFENLWIHDEPSMSPWEQSLWRTLAGEISGYDPIRKIVSMGTIPREPRTEPPRQARQLEPWRRYLAHNPRWTEGYTCLLMGRFDLSYLSGAVRWLADPSRYARKFRG